MPDEESNISEVQCLYGRHGRKCSGHKREGGCALPGEICRSALCYRLRETVGVIPPPTRWHDIFFGVACTLGREKMSTVFKTFGDLVVRDDPSLLDESGDVAHSCHRDRSPAACHSESWR